MSNSSKRSSSRKESIFNNIIPDSGSGEPEAVSNFIKDFYKPVAVLIAITILVFVSLHVYKGSQSGKLKSVIQALNEAETLEKLNNPNLKELVVGTKYEVEWRRKRLMKMLDFRKEGAKTTDYDGFIEESAKFIEMYPNHLATLNIMFVRANYLAFVGKIDEAKRILQDLINHPKAQDQYVKIRAEKELKVLSDPTSDPELDENFIASLTAFAEERLATPTPTPTPANPAVQTPAGEQVPPVDLNGVPAPKTAPKPVDLDNAKQPAENAPAENAPAKTDENAPETPAEQPAENAPADK